MASDAEDRAHTRIRQHLIWRSIGDNATMDYSIVKDSIIGNYALIRQVVLESSVVGNDAAIHGLSQSLNIGDNTEIDFG